MANPKKYAILILAAGASQRLGHPKQLVNLKDQTTLLNHTIQEAKAADIGDIYVAVASNAVSIVDSIKTPIHILSISQWNKGMGNTISESVQKLKHTLYDGIILSVCDQPFISRDNFMRLAKAADADTYPIILSDYGKAKGPPSYFSHIYIPELIQLTGDHGAKPIVKSHQDYVGYVEFKKGDIDIDTPEDLKHLE